VDPIGGKIYWSQWYPEGGPNTVYRANLDGSNVEDLRLLGLGSTTGLALDLEGGKLYALGYYSIYRSNLDGSGGETALRTGGGGYWGLALDMRVPTDCNRNRVVDLADHASFVNCLTAPGNDFAPGCSCADENGDRDVDLSDFAGLQNAFTAHSP